MIILLNMQYSIMISVPLACMHTRDCCLQQGCLLAGQQQHVERPQAGGGHARRSPTQLPFPCLATLRDPHRTRSLPHKHGQIVPKTPCHAPVGSEAPADDMHGWNKHCI